MKVRTPVVLLLLDLVAGGIGAGWYKLAHDATSPLVLSTSEGKRHPHVVAVPPPPEIAVLPISTEVSFNVPGSLPVDDLATLEMLLANFRKNEGGNPTGENEEITAALLGKNARRLGYLPSGAAFINDKGQIIDRWGSPYMFHSLAADHTEIRSAGPDRVMWTDDDVVLP